MARAREAEDQVRARIRDLIAEMRALLDRVDEVLEVNEVGESDE